MFYGWLDIHSKPISVCVLSETGQVVGRTQVRSIYDMRVVDPQDDGGTRDARRVALQEVF
jgi:hypothetical protein